MGVIDNPNEMKDVQEYMKFNKGFPMGPDGKPDLTKLPNDIRMAIVCTAGLAGDTPVLLSQPLEITSMLNIFMFKSGEKDNLPVFSFTDDNKVRPDQFIHGIPKELQVNEIYNVAFSNGYHLECSAGTLFKKPGDNLWAAASELKIGDTIQGAFFDSDRPQDRVVPKEYQVTVVEKQSTLFRKVYAFMSTAGNMLLPQVASDNSTISFVCVKQ